MIAYQQQRAAETVLWADQIDFIHTTWMHFNRRCDEFHKYEVGSSLWKELWRSFDWWFSGYSFLPFEKFDLFLALFVGRKGIQLCLWRHVTSIFTAFQIFMLISRELISFLKGKTTQVKKNHSRFSLSPVEKNLPMLFLSNSIHTLHKFVSKKRSHNIEAFILTAYTYTGQRTTYLTACAFARSRALAHNYIRIVCTV